MNDTDFSSLLSANNYDSPRQWICKQLSQSFNRYCIKVHRRK